MFRPLTMTTVMSFVLSACIDGASKQKLSGDGSETSGGKVGEVDISSSDQPLAAMKLCQSLMPAVPEHLLRKGAKSDSDAANSREACIVRNRIREALTNQQAMARDLCLLEAQKGLKAGGKYKFKFALSSAGLTQAPPTDPAGTPDMGGPGGPGETGSMDPPTGSGPEMPAENPAGADSESPVELSRAVFFDNSDPENFRIYMCDDGKLTTKVTVQNANTGGAKGAYKHTSDQNGSISILGSFDHGVSQPGRQLIGSQMAFEMNTPGSAMRIRTNLHLDLSSTEVSVLKSATEFSSVWSDLSSSDREIAVALIDPTVGAALFQRTFEGSDSFFPAMQTSQPAKSESGKSVETSLTFFDVNGRKLDQTASEKFQDSGALRPKEDMLPKLLPLDFSVGFDAADWDCSGTVEVAFDQSSQAYKEAEQKFLSVFEQEHCDEDDLVAGTPLDVPPLVDAREGSGPSDLDSSTSVPSDGNQSPAE